MSIWLLIIFGEVDRDGFRADSWNFFPASEGFSLNWQLAVLLSRDYFFHLRQSAMQIVIQQNFWFYWFYFNCILVVIFRVLSFLSASLRFHALTFLGFILFCKDVFYAISLANYYWRVVQFEI